MFRDQAQFSEEMLHGDARWQPVQRSVPSRPSPGFVTLAQALRSALTGGSDRSQVAQYQQALGDSLSSAQEKLHTLVVPTPVTNCVSPIVRNAEILMDKLTTVLDLVDEYLCEGSGDSLKEAVSLLDLVQVQMKVAY